MSDFTVRLLTPSEYPLIETLQLKAGQERFLPETMSEREPVQVWGLWKGRLLIGFVEVVGAPPVLWIARIGVDANFQGVGYGRKGMEEVVRSLRRRARIRELRAAVHQENLPAQRLFAEAGFQPLGEADPWGEIIYRFSLR